MAQQSIESEHGKNCYFDFAEHEKEFLVKKFSTERPALRAKVGVSQGKMAEAVGISRQTYNAYLNSGSVYSINGFDTSAPVKRIVDDSVSHFKISGNGNTIYYLTDERELFYQKGGAEPKLIDYDLLSSGDQLAVHDKSNTVFYINDGELFSSKYCLGVNIVFSSYII